MLLDIIATKNNLLLEQKEVIKNKDKPKIRWATQKDFDAL